MHNDILPLLFAAAGLWLAARTDRFEASTRTALALQMVPLLGLGVARVLC
jgi:hypothetical protein